MILAYFIQRFWQIFKSIKNKLWFKICLILLINLEGFSLKYFVSRLIL
jgi:hypothetical protein